ncbi:MAG TPA: ATP-binding cassette domain-containing protein, partial [Treponemataceae bacterium]|nr:ATP-binding cassette domain-containing protein [Treponemataceae bacterium]
MNLLSVSKLSKMGRDGPLFTDITFGLDEGEKAALIGKNGTGKSTLLNCLAGALAPDSGTVVVNKAAGVSFLPQNPTFDARDTIRAHI